MAAPLRIPCRQPHKLGPGPVDELGREIIYTIKHKLLVTPEIEVVDYGALPRTEKKSKRVFATRLTDAVVQGNRIF
jgi:phenylacetate-coenzyme A ligase PaaK-like adenylate-forming protein